jgi:hypothetical protein
MSEENDHTKSLRERLGGGAEDRLGGALSDLLESPLLSGAIGRAFDAREKAVQVQEVAMGALNLPSAADIERLTRRLRSVSLRLEGIEEALDRLQGALSSGATPHGQDAGVAERLSAIEERLQALGDGLAQRAKPKGSAKPAKTAKRAAKAGAGERRRAQA